MPIDSTLAYGLLILFFMALTGITLVGGVWLIRAHGYRRRDVIPLVTGTLYGLVAAYPAARVLVHDALLS